MRTRAKRLVLVLLVVAASLTAIYFLMKWTTPKDCQVPLDRMSQWCRDFIYN